MKEIIMKTEIYRIVINSDGIFRIHKNSKRKKEMLTGRFRIVKYYHGSDVFIVKVNKLYYFGTINKLLNILWSFRYKGSAPILRFILETYKFKKINKEGNL